MTATDVTLAPARRTSSPGELVRTNRVVQAALAMIAAQLAFRAWATYGMWYRGDDFHHMSRMMNGGPELAAAFRPVSGHIRPLSMLLTGWANSVAPFQFEVNASILLVLQVAADVGLLLLLLRLFGARAGILPPLAFYLCCAISVPMATWWVSGAAQIPLQALFFWTLRAHVAYLRSLRTRDALVAGGWVVLGFGFNEKTLLTLGALAIFSACYFTTGGLLRRVQTLVRRYRTGVLVYLVLGAGYLVVYIRYALTFEPGRAARGGLGAVISDMVLESWLPAMAGGPLRWRFVEGNSLAHPPLVVVLAGLVLVTLVVRELAGTRRRSLRAWWLLVWFLACDVVLVHAARTTYFGADLSLDYRFQGEVAAVTAVALACASLPVLGAVETVEVVSTSKVLGGPRQVAAVTAAVSVLGTVSATELARHWHHATPDRAYFGNLFADLSRMGPSVPVIDTALPARLVFGVGYPDNMLSRLLHDSPHGAEFVDVATDHVWMADHHGHVEPVVVPVERHARPGPHPGCGYRVRSQDVVIPLNGPLAYGGWWVRIGYLASGTSRVRVTTGAQTRTALVQPGVHALYLDGGERFDSVRIAGLDDNVVLCTDDVTVGRPVPQTEFRP